MTQLCRNCRISCSKAVCVWIAETNLTSASTVFGVLQEVVHDTYHCEDTFERGSDGLVTSPCSDQASAHRPSHWLEELVARTGLLAGSSDAEVTSTTASSRLPSDSQVAKQSRVV